MVWILLVIGDWWAGSGGTIMGYVRGELVIRNIWYLSINLCSTLICSAI